MLPQPHKCPGRSSPPPAPAPVAASSRAAKRPIPRPSCGVTVLSKTAPSSKTASSPRRRSIVRAETTRPVTSRGAAWAIGCWGGTRGGLNALPKPFSLLPPPASCIHETMQPPSPDPDPHACPPPPHFSTGRRRVPKGIESPPASTSPPAAIPCPGTSGRVATPCGCLRPFGGAWCVRVRVRVCVTGVWERRGRGLERALRSGLLVVSIGSGSAPRAGRREGLEEEAPVVLRGAGARASAQPSPAVTRPRHPQIEFRRLPEEARSLPVLLVARNEVPPAPRPPPPPLFSHPRRLRLHVLPIP